MNAPSLCPRGKATGKAPRNVIPAGAERDAGRWVETGTCRSGISHCDESNKESKKKQELLVLSSAGFSLQGCRIDTGAHDPRSFVALADNVFEKELRFVP